MDSGENEVEPSEPKPQWPEPKYAEARLEFYAKLAWLPDYTDVYLMEAEINGAHADVEEHCSEYRRLQVAAGDDDARRKSMLRISQDKERQLREQDRRYVGFSQAIKSAMFVIDQVPTKTWDKEVKDKKVPGRTYGKSLLEKMVDVRPDPPEPTNPDVSFYVFDQVNTMAGGGRGHGSKKFGGIGRFDKDGNRVEVQRETYINSFDVFVPAADCQLSDAARDVIERRGPYTQDFVRVLPVLAPQRAETFMDELLVAACASLRPRTEVRPLPPPASPAACVR